MTEHVEQMSSGQDHIWSGKTLDVITGEQVDYLIIFDGHGTNSCINFIRSIPKVKRDDIAGAFCPITTLFKYIIDQKVVRETESSGSTMCMVRRYEDRIECINSGDSQLVVFKNGKIEFISVEHNCANVAEKQRLAEERRCFNYYPTNNIKMISKDKLVGTMSEYANFTIGGQLATTQALGHNGKTGIFPDKTVIPYNETDDLRVIIGSDGLFDMIIKNEDETLCQEDVLSIINMPGELILKRAVDRWLQPWQMSPLNNTEFVPGTYSRSDCDDVCVGIMDIIPLRDQGTIRFPEPLP
jgi:Protein phosphatase 2C